MNEVDFPIITTVVQAEPWEKGHVARIISFPHVRIFHNHVETKAIV